MKCFDRSFGDVPRLSQGVFMDIAVLPDECLICKLQLENSLGIKIWLLDWIYHWNAATVFYLKGRKTMLVVYTCSPLNPVNTAPSWRWCQYIRKYSSLENKKSRLLRKLKNLYAIKYSKIWTNSFSIIHSEKSKMISPYFKLTLMTIKWVWVKGSKYIPPDFALHWF